MSTHQYPVTEENMTALPFFDDMDISAVREWENLAVNYVAVECWKAHRSKRRQQYLSLCLLPQMNMDILFEVLGHLHPFDLIHVSRTNKAFHQLLFCPAAGALWRSAFTRHPPLPPCPPEISGRRWARLLFGPQRCDECAAPNTLPDYIICRRLCTQCMNKKLYNGVPDYSASHPVNDLCPKTFRSDGSSRDSDSDVGRLWPSAASEVVKEYERLQAVDKERVEDAPSLLEAFVESRKKLVLTAEAAAEDARGWTKEILRRSQTTRERQRRRVVRRARKHLILEGYNAADLSELDEYTELENIQCLTAKRWRRIQPGILPRIEVLRDERVARERADLVTKRTSVAISAASHVLRTAPAQCWAYFPPNYTLETFAPLKTLIQDPSDDLLAQNDPRLTDALVGLPEFVAAWRQEKRELLLSILPQPTSPNAPMGLDRLELATSVFMCKGSWISGTSVASGRALIGWDGAGAHLRCRSLQRFWDHRVHYAPEGAAAARELVTLLELDPETTTAAEMDRICGNGSMRPGPVNEVEKRFLCAICPVETSKGITGRRAMRWRECVLHSIEQTHLEKDHAHESAAPAWMLLTDEATEDVYRREEPDPFIRDTAWMCTLCPEHYERRTNRLSVLHHIWATHSIRHPVEGTHYLYYAGSERTPRPYVIVSQPSRNGDGTVNATHLNLCCGHCPKKSLLRFFSLRAITRHIVDKHGISSPTEASGDWSKVELILRATPWPAVAPTEPDA
ncbi:hypothetical protein C8F01DRAFT_1101273 [Mycena amicta]|nr:hypothetical protein C8F01DRAFT_1101273 [Mycena amicta]